MAKGAGTAIDAKNRKLIQKELVAYSDSLQELFGRVKGEVEDRTQVLKKRRDKNDLLKSVKKEVLTWTKYMDLQGIGIVTDAGVFDELILKMSERKPPQAAVEYQPFAAKAHDEILNLIAAIGKVDDSPILESSTRKSFETMKKIVDELSGSALDLDTAIQNWRIAYTNLGEQMKTYFKKHPAPEMELDFHERLDTTATIWKSVNDAQNKLKNSMYNKTDAILSLLTQQTP